MMNILPTSSSSDKVVRSVNPVFSGINLIYNDIRTQDYSEMPTENADVSSIFEINHCREGRVECSSENEFFYLSPGDLSIHRRSASKNSLYFPSGRYYGVSVQIDVDLAPRCLSCFLDDVNVQPKLLMQKFCGDDHLFVARSDPHLAHIFSELYSIPEQVKKGYFKIKVLEILLFLSCLDAKPAEPHRTFSASQVQLAKDVCRFLTSHMDQRITIESLAEVFHVSPTLLKNCFKGVYGVSVYSFIRTQKMQSAAMMLKNSDQSILEIANLHGYDNGSKFAAAFRDTMGMTPTEYRKAHVCPFGA